MSSVVVVVVVVVVAVAAVVAYAAARIEETQAFAELDRIACPAGGQPRRAER